MAGDVLGPVDVRSYATRPAANPYTLNTLTARYLYSLQE